MQKVLNYIHNVVALVTLLLLLAFIATIAYEEYMYGGSDIVKLIRRALES